MLNKETSKYLREAREKWVQSFTCLDVGDESIQAVGRVMEVICCLYTSVV